MYDFRSLNRIEGLDGLRLTAVGLVLLGHFGIPKVPGGFGVTIFFFVSGFLITTLLVQEMRRDGSIGIRNFYIRRFLRLGPELLGLIVGSCLIGLVIHDEPPVIEVFAAIFYFTNYYIAWLYAHVGSDAIPHWTHLWSLSVEEHYYLTYPAVFALVFRHRKIRIAFFASLVIGCLAWRSVVVHYEIFPITWTNPYTYMASEARMDSIAYGALFAFLAQCETRAGRVISLTSLICGGGLILFTLVLRSDVFRETIRYSLQGLGLFLIFTHLYLSKQRSFLMPLLETNVARLGGTLSYGTYLWHGEVLRALDAAGLHIRDGATTTKLFGIPAGILASFAIAWASYKLLAVPAIKLRQRFGSHVSEPTSDDVATKPVISAA